MKHNDKITVREVAHWATLNHNGLLGVYEDFCEETGQDPIYHGKEVPADKMSLPEFAITMFHIGCDAPSLLRRIFQEKGYAVATPRDMNQGN